MIRVLIPLLLAAACLATAESFDTKLFAEMRWRSIGPFRGGRTKAAAGVPSQPNVFYIGAVNGGVWRTTDYGRTWNPIFDDQPTGSIGAIAVAPSNPNIIYVGSGEGLQRPDLSTGDGIYKSTDAGRTWIHLGLRDGQQIPQIAIDPYDPNRLFVAVLGHPYGANPERGIFRSIDGGRSFEKVLYKDENTGGSDVALDPSNAQIVYAGLWEARQGPWENAAWTGTSGGLFKSTDGGTTWRALTKGLPQGLTQVNIALAPGDPRRVYIAAATGPRSGIFRSDDAGESWTQATTDTRPALRIGGGDLPVLTVDPEESGYRVQYHRRDLEIHRWRQDLDRYPWRSRRRRLSAHVDQSEPSRDPSECQRSGRHHHGEWRRDMEFLVQPAHRADVSRRGGQRVSLSSVQRPTGERFCVRCQPGQ